MRLAHFKKNVGWAEVLKTLFIVLIAVGFALLNPEPPYSLTVVVLALCLPALGRKALASHPGFWSSVLARASLALMVAAFGLGLVRERLEGVPGIATALFGLLALYASAFFWLWSDPDVVRLERSS